MGRERSSHAQSRCAGALGSTNGRAGRAARLRAGDELQVTVQLDLDAGSLRCAMFWCLYMHLWPAVHSRSLLCAGGCQLPLLT